MPMGVIHHSTVVFLPLINRNVFPNFMRNKSQKKKQQHFYVALF